MNRINVKKLTLAALFAALAVVGSTFSFPVAGTKCAPVQHMVNVLGAIILGPSYAVGSAFAASLIRNLLGLGTLMAFPGSMCGAFLAGILYKFLKKRPFAYIGEVFGTSIIAGLLAYPVALFLLGNKEAAIFGYIIPFFISTAGGTIIAIIIIESLSGSGLLSKIKKSLNE